MMDQTPEMPDINQSWFTRYKKRLYVGTALLIIIILLLLAGLYYIRSGRLNRYITNQVVEALGEYGLRTEIGKFDIAWGIRTAKIRDIKIYNQQTGQLIATIERAEMVVQILEPFALRLRRELIFKRLDLTNLNIWFDVDQQGRSNLRGLHAAPPKAPSRITFDFSSLIGSLKGGTLHFNDRSREIEGKLVNLEATAQPLPGGIRAKTEVTASGGRFLYQGRETTVDGLDLAGSAGEAGDEVERFTLCFPMAQVSVHGRLGCEKCGGE